MALSRNEVAAEVMEHLVTCSSHGYSQYSRNGDGGRETITLSDGSTRNIATGDRDCSSAVLDAWIAAGMPFNPKGYTGNMKAAFLASGEFVWHEGTSYHAKRGDVYLNEAYHTAMCLHGDLEPAYAGYAEGADILGQFSQSETGGVDGQEGDQTGWESYAGAYYDYPWDGILEYVGGDTYQEGWQGSGDDWWYQYEDGTYPENEWKRIGDDWFYFGDNGWMKYGWFNDNGSWYYLNEKHDGSFGAARSDFVWVNGSVYYLNPEHDGHYGEMQTGWLFIGNCWYYAFEDGSLAVNALVDINDKAYAFGEDGKMLTGEIALIADSSGAIRVTSK